MVQQLAAIRDEVQEQIVQVRQVQATSSAFAAILYGGSVVTWGVTAVRYRINSNGCQNASLGFLDALCSSNTSDRLFPPKRETPTTLELLGDTLAVASPHATHTHKHRAMASSMLTL